jgi:DNA-binding transcriptional regulator YiaG
MTPEEVKAAREALGLTLDALGTALGVTGRAVRHWEAGTRNPSAAAAKLIGRMIQDHRRKERRKKS